MAVFPDEFKRISMCEIAKEACYILEVTYKGTKIVTKFQIICRDLISRSMTSNANIAPQGAPSALSLRTYTFDIIKIIK